MAVIAAFTDIDVTAFLFKGIVRGDGFNFVVISIDPGEGQDHGDNGSDENSAGRQQQQ